MVGHEVVSSAKYAVSNCILNSFMYLEIDPPKCIIYFKSLKCQTFFEKPWVDYQDFKPQLIFAIEKYKKTKLNFVTSAKHLVHRYNEKVPLPSRMHRLGLNSLVECIGSFCSIKSHPTPETSAANCKAC